MTAIEYLDQQVKKVCPALGLSIGKWDDKSTWRVNAPDATKEQLASVQSVFDAFDNASFEVSQTATPAVTVEELHAALLAKGVLTVADVTAAMTSAKTGA